MLALNKKVQLSQKSLLKKQPTCQKICFAEHNKKSICTKKQLTFLQQKRQSKHGNFYRYNTLYKIAIYIKVHFLEKGHLQQKAIWGKSICTKVNFE